MQRKIDGKNELININEEYQWWISMIWTLEFKMDLQKVIVQATHAWLSVIKLQYSASGNEGRLAKHGSDRFFFSFFLIK